MKSCLKRLISMLLVLCLCVSMAPATTQAAGAKPSISDAATTTISGANGDIVVTTSKVVLEGQNNRHYFYAMTDATDLDNVSGYWTVGFSESTSTSYLNLNSANLCSWRMNSFSYGWKTVTVTIYDNNNVVYGTGTMDVFFASQDEYPMTDEEAAAAVDAKTAPAGTIALDVYAYFGPTSAVAEETEVCVELLDRSGTVYGTTAEEDFGSVYTSWVEDTRFSAFFPDYSPYSASCMSVSAYLLCGKELVPGMYSLHFYTEDKSFEKTVPNAVEVTSSLMADMAYGDSILSYDRDLGLAGTTVRIRNGSPSDFKVQLTRGKTVLAVSNAYRPVDIYGNGELVIQYYIPVDAEDLVDQSTLDQILMEWGVSSLDKLTPEQQEMVLEQAMNRLYDLTLKLVGDDGSAVIGETERHFEEDGEGMISGFFASHFFANAVLLSTGLDHEETYKLTLTNSTTDSLLSEVLVSPGENGIFDVEFTDENGEIVELDTSRWGRYQIELYQKNWNDQWNTYSSGSVWISTQQLRTVDTMSLLSNEQTLPLNIDVGMNILEDGRISFYVDGSAADMQKLTDCELHLTPVGSNDVIVLDDVDYSGMEDASLFGYGWLYFSPDKKLPNGYYTGKLYCGNKLVTDMNGVDIMADENLMVTDTISGNIFGTYLDGNPLLLQYSAGLNNAGSTETGRLDFYAFGNRTGTPDQSFALDRYHNIDLTAAQLAELGSARYQAVLWADDLPVDIGDYDFWMSYDQMREYRNYYRQNGQVMRYGASVDPAIAGKAAIELIPCFGGTDANGDFQALSEIYVKVTPAKGQILDQILVNGKPITGRAFLLTADDTVVSATFRSAKTYKVTPQVYDNDNYYTDNTLADITLSAEDVIPGETVTVSVTPKDGYVLEQINVWSSAGHITDLTTNEDGSISFVMPEQDVKVQASVRLRRNLSIELQGGGTYGTLSVTPSSGLMEGDAFTLTVVPAEGYHLTNLTLSYTKTGEYYSTVINLVEEPNAQTFTQSFSDLPTSSITVRAEFAALTAYKVGISAGMIGGTIVADKATANPGDLVTLTVMPNENYRQNGDVIIPYSTTSGQKYVTPTQNDDGTWSFLMPWGDVYIRTSFILVGPGGEVRTPAELHAALGGCHIFDEANGTVKLSKDLILAKPITVLGDVGTLNLNYYDIGGPTFSIDAAPSGVLCIGENGKLHLTGNSGNITPDSTGSHAVQVVDGELTVDGSIYLYSAYATEMDTTAAIMVEGGNVTLGRKTDTTVPYVYGNRCADGVRITGGAVMILSGRYYGGKEFNPVEIMADASLMGGMEDGGYNSNSRGGSGVHVSDTGSLRIDNGYFVSGLNQAGVKISEGGSGAATGKIRIRGGLLNPEYYDNYGHGLWVDCQPEDLLLSGGLYRYSYNNYGFDNAIQLKNTRLSAYLADGVAVVNPDNDTAISPEQTYYFPEVELVPPASQVLAEDLAEQLDAMDSEPTDDQKADLLETVQAAFGSMTDDEKTDALKNMELSLLLLEAEQSMGIEVKVEADEFAISDTVIPAVVLAALNAQPGTTEMTLTVSRSVESVPAGSRDGAVGLTLELTGAADADPNTAGVQLALPLGISIALPDEVNPAYAAVYQVGQNGAVSQMLTQVYEAQKPMPIVNFLVAELGSFVLTEAVSAEKTDSGVAVSVDALHDTSVSMACAVYDANGRLMEMTIVDGSEVNGGMEISCTADSADHVKLFLLDNSHAPSYDLEKIVVE